ncbi:MAG: tetratricopeptide repeat protein [Candidatus Caenarcaniphilales bacterium]|nr:tetratricopeptide repeat protein [Candidatus Caenarcaniphilales bacterium]
MNKATKLLISTSVFVVLAVCMSCSKDENKIEIETKVDMNDHLIESFQDYSKKDYKDSIKQSTKVIQFNPDSPEAYFNRGLAKYKIKDKKGAMKDLEKAKVLFKEQNNNVGFQLASRTIENFESTRKKGLFN